MGIKRTLNKTTANFKTVYTLGDCFEEFIAEKLANNLSKATIESYEISFRLYKQFMEYTNETPMAEVSAGDFIYWKRTMALENIKHTSINHYLRDCRVFFNWCMDEDRKYIEERFKIELVKGQEDSIKCFDEDDLVALLEKPRDSDPFAEWRTWAITSWVLATGNRAATICEVLIGDVDFKGKEITLRHTKNKKALVLPLSSSLETVLKQYINIWRKGYLATDYLFPNVGNEKLTTGALKHAFAKYCNKRGVEQTNIHGLRHSFARQWVKSSGSVFHLQKILGHSTLAMTQRYVRLFNEDLKQDFDAHSALDTLKKSGKRTQTIKRR